MSQSIYSGAKAVYGLLENLLTWSRMQREGGMEYQPEQIELDTLIEETVELLGQTAADKEIELSSTIEDGLLVQADKHMLDTVVRNLTSNALKFTPRGGAVTLSARRKNSTEKGTSFVVVSVVDTGVGMSQADIDKLFRIDVNHSTLGTEKEQGSGLGLIICQEMVERNGGQIRVESAGVPGKGTMVEFTVPFAA
jgi:signal transduction histidine kinase